ncbi:hypothetical protein HDU80_001665 [Chytriomyces hyalinus]|nr:hypothetical protein HDU80_001665 [Chytriomyces hyalinus]
MQLQLLAQQPYNDNTAISMVFKQDPRRIGLGQLSLACQITRQLVHFAKYIRTVDLQENYWDLFLAHFAHIKTLSREDQITTYRSVVTGLGIPLDEQPDSNKIEQTNEVDSVDDKFAEEDNNKEEDEGNEEDGADGK